jgi:hypothetical protein
VIFHTANGQPMRRWTPVGEGVGFELSPVLEPLARHRDRLLVVGGLDVRAEGMCHAVGTPAALTGARVERGLAQGPSVDQIIGAALGDATPHRAVVLGVRTDDSELGRVSYAAAGQPMPALSDPRQAYTRLFRGLDGDAISLEPRYQGVLDSVAADLARLRSGLPAADRARLDQHTDHLADLERRLARTGFGAPPPGAPPVAAAARDAEVPTVGRAQMEIAVEALAVDATRVVTLVWEAGRSDVRFDWLDLPLRATHHELSHAIVGDTPPDSLPEERALVAINRWFAGELAWLADRMAATPDGDGSLLDNTVIVWTNELSDGAIHSGRDMPYVLLGGGAGRLRTGRHVRFDGEAHNRLLTTLCRVMGVEVDRVGDYGDVGPLDALLNPT